ncbi:Do family serine endopeptidase [Bacteroidia bacterium]|nr:Do family serine endopeptidase [Bacteroidia bacterium]
MNIKKALGVLFIAVLGGLIALGVNRFFTPDEAPQSFTEHENAKFTLAEKLADVPDVDFVSVADISTPAVVHIKTTMKSSPRSQQLNPFEDFFGPNFQQPNRGPQQATGSGVIIKKDGYIITNNHVVDNASKVEVILDDKRTYVAEIMGTDPETDLALLKIEESNLSFLNMGNSDELKVGEWVVAVGNPFNLTSTVTAGIVSAKGRNINLLRERGGEYAIENFIQTDAAVNPGNSGGALVNTSGELIGINTAIASQTGSYSGYSFAIPINLAKKIIGDLKDYGEVKRAILGVRIQDITQELADEKGLQSLDGVYIPAVSQGGSADKAGIKEGDVIIKIGENVVDKSSALQEQISKYHPGDKVDVTIIRDGKEKVINATLLSKDGAKEISTSIAREEKKVLGAEIENISRDERLNLRIKNGVKIAKLGNGAMKEKGIPSGFVITRIDKSPMYTTKDVENALKDKEGAVLIEGVTSRGDKEAYAIRLD